jgi:hypothetical protein
MRAISAAGESFLPIEKLSIMRTVVQQVASCFDSCATTVSRIALAIRSNSEPPVPSARSVLHVVASGAPPTR